MTSGKVSSQVKSFAASLVLGGMGAVLGLVLRPAQSHACECTTWKWAISMVSLVSSPGAADDSKYWPAEAVMAPLPETVSLRFSQGDDVWEIEADE